jgi:hypothetical protein
VKEPFPLNIYMIVLIKVPADPESAAEMSSSLSALGLPPASNATAIEAEIQQRRGQLALKLAKTATSPQELVAQQSRVSRPVIE